MGEGEAMNPDDIKLTCFNERKLGGAWFICDREHGHDGNHHEAEGHKIAHWWVNTCDHVCTAATDATGHRSCMVCRKSHHEEAK